MCTPRAVHGLGNPYSAEKTRCGLEISSSVVDDEKEFITCGNCLTFMENDRGWTRGQHPLKLVWHRCNHLRRGPVRYRAIAEGLSISVVGVDEAWVVERPGLYGEFDYFETWQKAARMAEMRLRRKARNLLAMLGS